ncbi:1-acyl-sn-glycerol-3-phosphate acyltransferase 1, chloroplastic [Iris pallida]|uniref:1-acyl-sn-glycerol-3-phosphate acyltransferase 1, chloroplastic n=1 Tax=Iris pallida TaxID=29817 RepID=A0AAX6GNP8_IRIPA|nr:1-acyl-sn-glycerol-3-phosphate acyltransferase 1, chloroplastic [Iris pallida]
MGLEPMNEWIQISCFLLLQQVNLNFISLRVFLHTTFVKPEAIYRLVENYVRRFLVSFGIVVKFLGSTLKKEAIIYFYSLLCWLNLIVPIYLWFRKITDLFQHHCWASFEIYRAAIYLLSSV